MWMESINGEGYAKEKKRFRELCKGREMGKKKKKRVRNVKAKNYIRDHTNKTQSGESIKREEWRMYFNNTLRGKEKRTTYEKKRTNIPHQDMNELKHIELENPIVKHKTEKLLDED